jgi:hypothetical protein
LIEIVNIKSSAKFRCGQRWLGTIAMSPYNKLIGVLAKPDLLIDDNPQLLFDKRDEI